MRPTRLIGQTGGPVGLIASEALVAGLPADPVRGTELGEGHEPAQGILDELVAQLHGDHLLLGHRILLEGSESWR